MPSSWPDVCAGIIRQLKPSLEATSPAVAGAMLVFAKDGSSMCWATSIRDRPLIAAKLREIADQIEFGTFTPPGLDGVN